MYKHTLRATTAFALLTSFFSFTSTTNADTIWGTFFFDQRPPAAAVVYLKDGRPSDPSDVIIHQLDGRFSQTIAVAPKGSTVIFRNSDDRLHELFGTNAAARIRFEGPLTEPQNETLQAIDWEAGEFITVSCRVSPTMRSWIGSIPTTDYAAVEFAGETQVDFSLENLSASASQIVIWFPRYDPIALDLSGESEASAAIRYKGLQLGTVHLSRKP